MTQEQMQVLKEAFDAYAVFRKDAKLTQDVAALWARWPDMDRALLQDLNEAIPPPPQATAEFMDWSDAPLEKAYETINAFLDEALARVKIPRWYYSFEHLRLAQSLIHHFLAPALAGNPTLGAFARSLRSLGMKFSGKAVDYVRVPYTGDRVRAMKRLGFVFDTAEFASSATAVFRHAHGIFCPLIVDFSAGASADIDSLRAQEPSLRLRDRVDPEWLDMRDVYDAVKAGIAGQIYILEDVPERTKVRAMEFLAKQQWPELELVEDRYQEWASGKFLDALAAAMPDLKFALEQQEMELVEVGVRMGGVETTQALLSVSRPVPKSGVPRIAYLKRLGDTVLYGGYLEGKIPEGFQPRCFKIRYGMARWIMERPLLFVAFLGPVRLAQLLCRLVGRNWARLLFIESPDRPWLENSSMGRKFRQRVDALLGDGAWKYFVDHRTIRFTGEVQRSVLDRLTFAPRRNDFDTAREVLRVLGFQERERYNPLNTDWEAQVVWIVDRGHCTLFLDKPLEGMRGHVAKFSAVWRALSLFGIRPPSRTCAPPLAEDKWAWEDIGPRIESALAVRNPSDRLYLLAQWRNWLTMQSADAQLVAKVESGCKTISGVSAWLADAQRAIKAAFSGLLLTGPTTYFFHHIAIEGVFDEIGAQLSYDGDAMALRKDRMTKEEINSGFIARFSKKIARRQAFSLESRVLQPWLLIIPYVFGRLSREEILGFYEDAGRHGGRVLTMEGPHYENIDRRAGMHKFDQGKVDIAIKTASEAQETGTATEEGFFTRALSAIRWLCRFYGRQPQDPEYGKVSGPKSVIAATQPATSSMDGQPVEIWVADAGSYRAPSCLEGLSVQTKQRDLSDFGHDESGGKVMAVAAVVAPKTEKQLAEILKRFSAQGRPLTVAAANTGLSRGAVPPAEGEDVLSMRLFTGERYRIAKDEKGKSFAVVAAGIALQEFQDFVESQGLYYPPDPTERSSLIGGNVATNASGPRTFQYGPTRDWVRALRVVLANGDVLDIRRGRVFADSKGQFTIKMTDGSIRAVQIPSYAMPNVKNAAGYYTKSGMDLIDLFIGSEGTLGVITQVEVALVTKPAHRVSGNVYFPSEEKALSFVKAVRTNRGKDGVDLSLLEYFDSASVQIMREKDPGINKDAGAAIYFEAEVSAKDPAVEKLQKVMADYDALGIQEAAGDSMRAKLRDQRHSVPEEVNRRMAAVSRKYPGAGIGKVASDIAVPDDRLEEMMAFYKSALAQRPDIPYAIWGHIGNNHVHVNMLPQNPDQHRQAKEILLEFARKAVALGGTVTAEHGTGKIKVPQLAIMMGDKAIAQMAAVKNVLDPSGILGHGTLF